MTRTYSTCTDTGKGEGSRPTKMEGGDKGENVGQWRSLTTLARSLGRQKGHHGREKARRGRRGPGVRNYSKQEVRSHKSLSGRSDDLGGAAWREMGGEEGQNNTKYFESVIWLPIWGNFLL